MSIRNFRRSVLALVLVALLGAPLTSAAASRSGSGFSGPRQASGNSAVTWLWGMLGGLAREGRLIGPLGRGFEPSESTNESCRIDSRGRCVTSPEPAAKEGCSIDPFGRCI